MCDLCELKGCKFKITICNTCQIPLIVLNEHRAEFTAEEKIDIIKSFPSRKIRWEMRKIKDHAHCHILS